MPTEHFLNNLIINKVDTAETYKAMKTAGMVNENEIYIIEDSNTQSDWNENNPESKAHVKNRFGGYSVFDEREIVSEAVFENPVWVDGCSEYDILISTNPRWLELTSDEITEVHVTFDGKLYVCKNENGRIGNAEIYGGSNATNSDAPFAISVNAKAGSPYVALFTPDEAATHSVRITSIKESIVKIPEKYLPDTVATKADIEAAIGAAISASY